MKQWLLFILLLLSACGGGHQAAEDISNPYAERMRELSRNGIIAMQRERWDLAERSFDRSLTAARLANDRVLIAQALYNLGILYSAKRELEKAEHALLEAEHESKALGSEVLAMRIQLALALAHQKQGKQAWHPDEIVSGLPVDVQLSAARLAQLQGNNALASELYRRVAAKSVKSRQDLIYRGEACLGLALLADADGDVSEVLSLVAKVQEIARKAGIPRLAAHAYLLQAAHAPERDKSDLLWRAADIYRELDDATGLRKALQELLVLAKASGNQEQVKLLSDQLSDMENR